MPVTVPNGNWSSSDFNEPSGFKGFVLRMRSCRQADLFLSFVFILFYCYATVRFQLFTWNKEGEFYNVCHDFAMKLLSIFISASP